MPAMRILALDTATTLCGVAAYETQGQMAAVRRQQVTTHSEMLLSLISDCLAAVGWRPNDLDGVVCGAGPGSFTGLRIGLATAKGLCFALGTPLVQISSLQVLAARGGGRTVLASLDAFKGQVFARLFLPDHVGAYLRNLAVQHPTLLQERTWDPAQLAALLQPAAAELYLCGSGVLRYPQLQLIGSAGIDQDPFPHPLDLARLGAWRLQLGERADVASATPNYVCSSAAELPPPAPAVATPPAAEG